MSVLSSKLHQGSINLPGASAASKAIAERLLRTDHESYHCFFRPSGVHNHLSHHLLAAYDLGAPSNLIQAIYDAEAKIQRPINLAVDGVLPEGAPKPGDIKDDNWTKWLGDAKAYFAYVSFFTSKISSIGIARTLEEYIFSPAANGNGSYMLLRLVGGAFHPFIQVGYGLEFGIDIEVAAGLAQTAVHEARSFVYLSPDKFQDATPAVNGTAGKGRQPATGPSLFSILRQIYDSPKLTPVLPYDPDSLLSKRLRDFLEGGTRLSEMQRIFSTFDPGNTHEALDSRVEEFVFLSTLLTFGTGRVNRKPRVDFFLMHLLTSTLFIPSFFKAIKNIEYKRDLLRTVLQPWGTIIMIRGRPRINPKLIMSYTDNPVPPNSPVSEAHPTSLSAEQTNPWPAIITDTLHAPDSHNLKVLRTLLYGATRYGTLAKGDVIGAWGMDGKETHDDISEVDGTIFIRSAGILMEAMGWVTHGQEAKEWDRSALGWDGAWENEDERHYQDIS